MIYKRLLFFALFVTLLLVACAERPSSSESTSRLPVDRPDGWKADPGQPALDFEVETLDGGQVQLSDYIGSGPVLLNFMHTWCVPCNKSAPRMVTVYDRYNREGFTIVSVSVSEPVGAGKDFVARYNITYPFVRDLQGNAFRKYGLLGMPTSLLLDSEGVIQAVWSGELTESQIEEAVIALLQP